MARTKASVGTKVSMGKSSKARCSAAPTTTANSSSGEKSSRSYSGGNPVCPRETPIWQKPITTFIFSKQKNVIEDLDVAHSSKPKRRIIYSDDESDSETNNINANDKGSEINVDKPEGNEMETDEKQKKASENDESQVDENKEKQNEVNGSESQDYDLIKSPPKNRELDESIILKPLTGENSHKMEEYFSKCAKNEKSAGKKSNKENLYSNKVKRNFDDEYEESPRKKIRVE